MDEVPELPDWVKVLIEDAREEGYSAGFGEAEQYVWQQVGSIAARNGAKF